MERLRGTWQCCSIKKSSHKNALHAHDISNDRGDQHGSYHAAYGTMRARFPAFIVYDRHTCHAQVFVANPNKSDSIVDILTSNKEKLLKYLGDFHTDKGAHITAFEVHN